MSTSSNSEKAPRSSRIKNALKNLALCASAFALCIAVTEVILRLMGYGNLEIYEPDRRLYWRLKPNQNCYTKVNRKPVRVNALGTRGAEFSARKPAGTIRILSLGDSKTFGWGLSEDETYSAVLERLLRERLPEKKIEVINAGVNAWSYPQMSAFFRERALAWQPDMVLLADANPWTQFREEPDAAFLEKFLWRVRLKNFLRRFALYHYIFEVKLQKVYESQRAKFVPVDPKQDALFKEQQSKDPDALFRNAIDRVCSTALTNGVRPVLLYIPLQDAMSKTNNSLEGVLRAKQQVAAKGGIPLVDATPDLRARANELYLEGDTVHLNAVGNEIIGRRLADIVIPLLKDEQVRNHP